jgi:hypothetical protein
MPEHQGQHTQCLPCNVVVGDMRRWIEDCGHDTDDVDRRDIVDAVARNYDGGIDQFLLDGVPT